MQKKISVVIPFYNNVEWLEEAVQSVLNQTYKNYEIIVVNDGSPENIDSFLEKYNDKITYIKTENKGPGPARNLGIENANGEYIAFLDSDDLWLPNKLEVQIGEMLKNNLIWSHCSYSLFNDKDGGFIKNVLVGDFHGDVSFRKYISSPIATPCVIIKKSLFDENSKMRFSEKLRFGQDAYLWGLVSEVYPLGAIDDVLAKVRIRGSNAGRRARVQLQARANTWVKISNRREKKEMFYMNFPKLPLFLFCSAYNMNKLVIYSENKLSIKPKTAELLSKILYTPIYLGFKIYNITIR